MSAPSAPPPHAPGYAGWCDPGVAPPCLYGLGTWVWILLIVGFSLCFLGLLCFMWRCYRQGNSLTQLCGFGEAVLSAAHSYPNNGRLHGRASSSHPCLDLIEAQNCCCCFPLSLGLTLLGVLDLTRLSLEFAYDLDGIIIYGQTFSSSQAQPAPFDGLMVPVLRESVEAYLWPCMIASSVKMVLWVLTVLGVCCEVATPLRLLILYLPVDFGFTVVFAVFNTMFAEEICQVDLRIYAQSQHIGVRRNYLANLPPGPLMLDERGVPEVCRAFFRQELTVALSDCVGCVLLGWCIFYIGYSRLRSWDRFGGAIKNGITTGTRSISQRV